ncbi:DUF4260 domain-containing protein [uncultured Chryseobacterium sp.]|uniref:DUF4260 domain-containing protein n=1 Tax=uncultured Chryseobacterium sp. TaxID=259322 RepID=UPI0025CFD792|nr:DUF4260 domain-containing protein [uncultured Chryseobacterium sp.]
MTTSMRNLLKLEELGQFCLSVFLFSRLEYSWWIFPLFLLLPDVSMIGYVINPKTGARLYNFFHHKMTAVFVLVAGFFLYLPEVELAGIILLGHSSMDRIFGYGLKFRDDFRHTHLGWIGKNNKSGFNTFRSTDEAES